MPRIRGGSWWLLLTLLPAAGCAGDPLVMKGQLQQSQQKQLAMQNENRLLQERLSKADAENANNVALLSQARQQAQVSEEALAALREQLRGVTSQLTQLKTEKGTAEKKVEAMTASMRRQGGVSIAPNNSFLSTLPALQLPSGHVRRDGDVIRVALPGNQLFESGNARLKPGAVNLIANAANEIARLYPDQIIGVEGYTDTDPITGGQWRSNHELSVARAMAVYEVLAARTRLLPAQLFIVGHGPNHPMVSNATPEGKETNRRVELVVYPEKKG